MISNIHLIQRILRPPKHTTTNRAFVRVLRSSLGPRAQARSAEDVRACAGSGEAEWDVDPAARLEADAAYFEGFDVSDLEV